MESDERSIPGSGRPPDPEPAEGPEEVARMRLSVELEGDVVAQFERLRKRRNLSKSQAVRRALSLLAVLDEDRYELIMRDTRGEEPDRKILLLP